jgi:hypothetical protein
MQAPGLKLVHHPSVVGFSWRPGQPLANGNRCERLSLKNTQVGFFLVDKESYPRWSFSFSLICCAWFSLFFFRFFFFFF